MNLCIIYQLESDSTPSLVILKDLKMAVSGTCQENLVDAAKRIFAIQEERKALYMKIKR